MASLLFIDTNIFLDFYRMDSGGAAQRQLDFIDSNHDRIIVGNQVQMEFMKHRQQVIIDTINKIKKADSGTIQMPPILVDAQPAAQINKRVKEIEKQQKKIRARIEKILLDPTKHDAVYQCCQRLFKNNTDLNLDREKEIRFEIRDLAQKRYRLGYPPRKSGDTSMGDAVNWEWIVYCAKQKSSDVLVVSRDSDYGRGYQNKTFINDWLSQEFKARVSKKKKIELTLKLTDAMERFKVRVTREDKEQEAKLLVDWSEPPAKVDWATFLGMEYHAEPDLKKID